jgi:hypothetical protein
VLRGDRIGPRALVWSEGARRDVETGRVRRRSCQREAELVLKPVRGQPLRYALRSRCGGAEAFSYDRTWAAQRTPHKLRRRSIAAPGRASRLGVASFMRLLARSRHLLRGIG